MRPERNGTKTNPHKALGMMENYTYKGLPYTDTAKNEGTVPLVDVPRDPFYPLLPTSAATAMWIDRETQQ